MSKLSVSEVIEQFFSASQNPVVFCGAGVSARAGIPIWSKYLSQLAELIRADDTMTRHQMDDCIREGDYEAAASYYFLSRKAREADLYDWLTRPLASFDSDKLIDLASLPAKAFVTTNFDRSLLDAYAKANAKSAIEAHYPDPSLKEASYYSSPYIARIHGRVEVPSEILLTGERLAGAADDPLYRNFLLNILTRNQVLFLGISFVDPALKRILEVMKVESAILHDGRHLALLPSDADAELVRQLEGFSIKKHFYSPKNDHDELWGGIKRFGGMSAKDGGGDRSESLEDPFHLTKQYIATCYARKRMKHDMGPLLSAIVEGVVSSKIRDCYPKSVSLGEVKKGLRKQFFLSDDRAQDVAASSVRNLEADGFCQVVKREGEAFLKWVDREVDDVFKQAINKLSIGLENRIYVRENMSVSAEVKRVLFGILESIILERGWDLGAAFAGGRVPDQIDVDEIVRQSSGYQNLSYQEASAIRRALISLLEKPEQDEAKLLSELGRVSFGLELLTNSPNPEFFSRNVLPEKIYLDANVLMPLIVEWHPHHNVYKETFRGLRSAVTKNDQNVKIYAFKGFLNEVCSHRELSKRHVQELKSEDMDQLRRKVRLTGSANTNVYVGAYANFLNFNKAMNFYDFLRVYAPYMGEKNLEQFLSKDEIGIVKDSESLRSGSRYSSIWSTLESRYSDELEYSRKPPVVIEHDAKQLALLDLDRKEGVRSIFVTADKSLREAIDGTQFSHLGDSMVSHVGITQLVDLLVGGPGVDKGINSLIWSSCVSSEADRIRNHFIDLALEEHNAAMTKNLYHIIEDISEDVSLELKSKAEGLDNGEGRSKVSEDIVESFENKFYEKMRKELERLERER